MFSEYLGIARNCLIHNKYCNLLLPISFTGALCKKLIVFSTDLTLVIFNLEQLSLSKYTAVVKDKYLPIVFIKISPSFCAISKLAIK